MTTLCASSSTCSLPNFDHILTILFRKVKRELKKLQEESTRSIEELKQQNFILQQQADQQRQKLEAINRQKLQLEKELEVENEKNFNLGSSPNAKASPLRLRAPSASSPTNGVPIPLRSPVTHLTSSTSRAPSNSILRGHLWAVSCKQKVRLYSPLASWHC